MWAPDSGIGDVLEQGEEIPRRPFVRSAAVAALLLGVGSLAGYEAHDLVGKGAAAGHKRLDLVAGLVEKDARLSSDAFVIPLHNGSRSVVTILDVNLDGWKTVATTVSIPPRSWGDVQIDLRVDCSRTPYATHDVIVRATAGHGQVAQVLPMPALPGILNEEVSRRCAGPPGTAPTRDQLLGVWLVERALRFAGEMLIRLDRDGTFAMDPDVGLFTGTPAATGSFDLSGERLTLHTRGGSDCDAGNSAGWNVALLDDGRLRIEHVRYHGTQDDSWCRTDPGEVWIAKRVGEASDGSRAEAGTRVRDTSSTQPSLVPTVPGVQP